MFQRSWILVKLLEEEVAQRRQADEFCEDGQSFVQRLISLAIEVTCEL